MSERNAISIAKSNKSFEKQQEILSVKELGVLRIQYKLEEGKEIKCKQLS